MTHLQNPSIPAPISAVEIDKAMYELQLKLDTNLSWLSNSYGRAYRRLEKKEKNLYFPEVYAGGKNYDYYRVTPDNDKKAVSFFAVGKEDNYDYDNNQYNYLKWDLGIVFWANQELINKALITNEIFRQNLIRDVRDVLTRKLGGCSFNLKIKDVCTKLEDVYKEFTLNKDEEYFMSPYTGFRFNCEIVMQEDCNNLTYDPIEALKQNISPAEIRQALLPTLDFSDPLNFNALTAQQKTDLLANL